MQYRYWSLDIGTPWSWSSGLRSTARSRTRLHGWWLLIPELNGCFFMGKTSSRNCILMSHCQDTSFTYIYIAVNGMKRNAPRSVKMNMVWFSACWDPAKRWQGKEKAGTGVVLPRLHDQQLKEYCNEESPTTWNIVTPVKEVWKNK